MTQHSVWGASAPPGTYTWYTDGSPSIWTAMGFYRTIAGTPVESVVGARLWVTSAVLAANSTASIRVFTGGFSGSNTLADVNAGFAAPIETKTLNITETGWNEVLFDNPIPAEVAEIFYIGVQYGGTDDGYLHSGALGGTAATMAENGMGFCLGGSGGDMRAVYKIGTNNFATPGNGALYGLDIIFDDGEGGPPDTTPPSVPTGLSIGSITPTRGTASWTASTDDVGVTGYEVFKDGVSAGTTGTTSFTLTGLTPSTEYDITVRARDAAANWSAQSSAVSFTTAAAGTGADIITSYAGAPTTSHTIDLTGAVAGRDIMLALIVAATPTVPSPWVTVDAELAAGSSGYLSVYRLDESETTPSSVTVTLNGSRSMGAVVWQDDVDETSIYIDLPGDGSGPSGTWGTGLHTYASKEVGFALFGGISMSMNSAISATSYDEGHAAFGTSGFVAGGGNEAVALFISSKEPDVRSNSGVTLTLANGANVPGASGMLAYDRTAGPGGDTTPPTVPTGVEVTPASTSATVEWNASTDAVGVTGYQVFIDGVAVGTTASLLYHVTGLTAATSYNATVRARDAAGNWSAQTTAVPFTTLAATRLTIAEENALPGTDRSFWLDVGGAAGDTSNVGYAKTFSNEVGTTVQFACHGGGSELQIYRLGWYGGAGARHVDTVAVTPTTQPAGVSIASSNNGIQFSGWTANASWDIPAVATSGFYLGLYRNAANNNASWIPFIVKDSARASDIVYKTSDTTWMIAYNHYGGPGNAEGGASFYGSTGGMGGGITTRAHACSYDRPYVTRSGAPLTAWSNAELPMIRWIERMGYEVKYVSCMDLHDNVNCLSGAKVFVSSGHDEYWSTQMRDNAEAFRDAGGHLTFFSGNEVFWRIRRDTTDPKIIWCYKDTMPGPGGHTAGVPLDPVSWTGTWKDTRWGSRRPENLTTGTDFRMNAMASKVTTFQQEAAYAAHPVWRNSALAAGADQAVTGIVGFEADEMLPALAGDRTVTLASETYNIDDNRADNNGENYNGDGNLNWGVVAQRYPSGAVVIGFGTVQWSWGLDTMHDATNTSSGVNLSMQQFTYNLLRDLGAAPGTPHTGIVTSAPVALGAYGLTHAPAPVSEYGFEDGNDKSGNGHHLTTVGTPSVAGGHATSRAARTGVNRFEGPIGPNTSYTDYTLMAWVKFSGAASSYRSVLSNGSSFYFDFEGGGDGNLRLYLYSGVSGHPSGLTGYTSAGAVGQWIHVACTRNAAGVAKVYVNGVEVATGNGNAYNFSDPNLEVGSNNEGNSYVLDGVIDDLRLFNSALTAAQITEWSAIPVSEATLTTVTKNVTSSWAAVSRVTKNIGSSWVAAQRLIKTVDSAWATRFTGLRQVTAAWSVKVRVTTTVTSYWAALQRITKNVPTGWGASGVTYTLVKSVGSEWAARVSGNLAVSSSWVTRVQLVRFVTARWVSEGITYTLTRTVDSGWAARIQVTGTMVTASWSTRTRLAKSVLARWVTLSDVPVGDDQPVVIVLARKPGGRAFRSISIRRRR